MKKDNVMLLLSAVIALAGLIVQLYIASAFVIAFFIPANGVVKITTAAVDRGDCIDLKVRVANVDTRRYLSNFYFSFMSYERDAYKLVLTNIVPVVVYTNEYYFGPTNTWDDQGVELDPTLSITRGESFLAEFVLVKNTKRHIAKIYGHLGYRGLRFVDYAGPKDSICQDFTVIMPTNTAGQP
ncbi:MAG: hypothetical protein NTV22_13000 [bacterium]|nr:hypothetical protein [bacterium]